MSALPRHTQIQTRFASFQPRLLIRNRVGATKRLPLPRHRGFDIEEGRFRPFQFAFFSTRGYFDSGENTSTITTTSKDDGSKPTMESQLPKESLDTLEILSQSIAEALDKNQFPMGNLSVDDFLDLEETLNDSIHANNPVTQQSIDEWLLLYRRLVEECDANPQLLENFEMAHWRGGNYPRSVKLLDDILGQWYKWRTGNDGPESEGYNPLTMLELVDNLRSDNLRVPVTDRSFNTLIRAATKRGDPAQAPIFANYLLNRMLEESLDHPMMRPTTNTMNAVLHSWAKSGLPDAPEKAEALFRVLCEYYDMGVLESPPENSNYLALMLAWSKSGRSDAAPKVDEILDRMTNAPWESVMPDTAAYRLVIHSWVNSENTNANVKMYSRFVEIVHKFMSSRDENFMIDGDLFSIVISKLAKERNSDKAEEIFQLLQQLQELTGDNCFQPSKKTLLGMVIAYSYSTQAGAAEKAEATLRQVERLARSKGDDEKLNPELLPKRGYYVDVIKALSNSHRPEGVEQAEELLLSMIDHHRIGAVNMLPDNYLCNGVLTAWARSGRSDAAERAEIILKLMYDVSLEFKTAITRPNEYSYLQLINAWSRSQDVDAPKHAEEVFCEMLNQFNAGDESMAPSVLHYTALISCWARSNQADGAVRAQSLFDATVERYESGDRSFKPDATLYMSLMRAWSMVGDAAKVEAIFLSMYEEFTSRGQKRLTPNTTMFNIMLEAWLRSDNPEAQQKAVVLFDSMVQFSEENTLDVKPDGRTYRNMIEIMGKSQSEGSAEQAEKYLQLLKETPILADRRGQEKIFSCYVSTLAAWGRKSDAKAMARKAALVEELTRLVQSKKIPLPPRSELIRFLGTVAQSGIPDKSEKAVATLKMPQKKLRVTRDLF